HTMHQYNIDIKYSYNLDNNFENKEILKNMKKTIVFILEKILWAFIILPGLFVASLVDYSAESRFDIFTPMAFRLAFFSFILSIIAVFITLFSNKQSVKLPKYLCIAIFVIIASYLPIFSTSVAYFIRAYGIYNIVVLGTVLVILSGGF
ncbi:hypothetical protein B6D11_13215, partial [Gilliamella apicola]